jgi:hypothetical protein
MTQLKVSNVSTKKIIVMLKGLQKISLDNFTFWDMCEALSYARSSGQNVCLNLVNLGYIGQIKRPAALGNLYVKKLDAQALSSLIKEYIAKDLKEGEQRNRNLKNRKELLDSQRYASRRISEARLLSADRVKYQQRFGIAYPVFNVRAIAARQITSTFSVTK